MRRDRNAERISTSPPNPRTTAKNSTVPQRSSDDSRANCLLNGTFDISVPRGYNRSLSGRCSFRVTCRESAVVVRGLFLQDVQRPALCLLENPAHVFAQQTKRAQDAAAYQ